MGRREERDKDPIQRYDEVPKGTEGMKQSVTQPYIPLSSRKQGLTKIESELHF